MGIRAVAPYRKPKPEPCTSTNRGLPSSGRIHWSFACPAPLSKSFLIVARSLNCWWKSRDGARWPVTCTHLLASDSSNAKADYMLSIASMNRYSWPWLLGPTGSDCLYLARLPVESQLYRNVSVVPPQLSYKGSHAQDKQNSLGRCNANV